MVYSGHHGDFHNPGGTGGDAVLGEHQRHRAVLIQIEGGGVIHSGEAALLRGEEEAALIRRDLRIYGVIADADQSSPSTSARVMSLSLARSRL